MSIAHRAIFVFRRWQCAHHARHGGVIDSSWERRGEASSDLFRGADTHARSVHKAISWRTLGTLDTFAIGWFMTGKIHVAGSIAGMEISTKVAWYDLHERLWTLVPWGHRDRGAPA
jgi:uncharacterized membrane protein